MTDISPSLVKLSEIQMKTFPHGFYEKKGKKKWLETFDLVKYLDTRNGLKLKSTSNVKFKILQLHGIKVSPIPNTSASLVQLLLHQKNQQSKNTSS